MSRSVFALTFTGLLAVLVGIFGESAAPFWAEFEHRPYVEGETLSMARLAPSERVVIAYSTCGCFHQRERLYQIEGEALRFAARALHPGATDFGSEDQTTQSGRLQEDETAGLDAYLHFLRYGLTGGCTTRDEVVVGYYRDGKKIGEERFHDGTGLMLEFHREEGKVVVAEQFRSRDFPEEVFRTIVPPWLIEDRLRNPESPQERQNP